MKKLLNKLASKTELAVNFMQCINAKKLYRSILTLFSFSMEKHWHSVLTDKYLFDLNLEIEPIALLLFYFLRMFSRSFAFFWINCQTMLDSHHLLTLSNGVFKLIYSNSRTVVVQVRNLRCIIFLDLHLWQQINQSINQSINYKITKSICIQFNRPVLARCPSPKLSGA